MSRKPSTTPYRHKPFTVTDEQWAHLKRVAERAGVPVQHAAREALVRGLRAIEESTEPYPLGIPGVTVRRAPRRGERRDEPNATRWKFQRDRLREQTRAGKRPQHGRG